MGFGIGRVPKDVDPVSESLARLEADEIARRQELEHATDGEAHVLRTWRCCTSDRVGPGDPTLPPYHVRTEPGGPARPVGGSLLAHDLLITPDGTYQRCSARQANLTILRSNLGGSGVMCEQHWLAYQRRSFQLPDDVTVDQVLAHVATLRQLENSALHRCAQCTDRADWNSGAGQYLCPRHWDTY